MAITYNAVTDTITVTGYTEGTPCTFLDIYNADVSGSWGQVTRQCQNQYCFNCKLVVGDGSTATWFKDVNAHISFNKDATGNILETEANSNFQLGECDANDRTSGGCAIYGISSANATTLYFYGNVKLYGSCLSHSIDDYLNINFSTTGTVELIDVIISQSWATLNFSATPASQKLKRITILGGNYGILAWSGSTITLSDILLLNVPTPLRVGASTLNATNIQFEGETYLARMHDNATINMYDSPISAATIYDSGSNWVVNEYFHFNLKLVDINEVAINGAKAKIWDIDDTLKVNTTTGSSGSISEQTLDYATRPDTQTRTLKTPHELRMYKYGKELLSSKTTIEKETDWIFTMYTDDHITQTTEATVAAYTGITINHTAETITISENHTLDEIYDYCQYDIIAATKQLDQTMHTSDGVNFVSEYSFVVNTGITVTATDQKLSMISGETYTLTGTAQFTGVIVGTETTINKQISLGTDDCYESGDVTAYLTDTTNYAGHSSTQLDMGLRWQSVNIPQGSSITSAKVSLYLVGDTGTLSANIRGIDEDDTVTWASDDRPSQRVKTSATIAANETNWNNWAVSSWIDIDITSVIQEIINRVGWSANNALAIVIEDTAGAGTNYINARAYEYAGNLHGAKLDVVYEQTTTRIPVKLTNIIDGSRYWVGKESDGSEIFDGTQSGSGDVIGYYEHTANTAVDIRVRKSSASVKYKPWVGEGTLIAAAFSLRIRQIQDSIIT